MYVQRMEKLAMLSECYVSTSTQSSLMALEYLDLKEHFSVDRPSTNVINYQLFPLVIVQTLSRFN